MNVSGGPALVVTKRFLPVLWAVLGLAIVLLLLSCYQRAIHIDEAWIGEQAYWAAKEGIVRSELFRGDLQAQVRQFVYHKLLVWQAAGLIRLLGWSVLTVRLLSVFYLLLFVGVAYRYLRTLSWRHPQLAPLLFMALLLANALITEYSFKFRPELSVMTLGFLSWICLETANRQSARRMAWGAGAGLLAGLAMLAHLNGVIFVVAGAGLLLWRRQGVAFGVFSLAVLACGGLYFWEVATADGWALFKQQLSPALHSSKQPHYLPSFILRLLHEHQRLFHSTKEASLSVLALVAGGALYCYRHAFRGGWLRELVGYTLALVLLLACISQNDNSFYSVLYIPYLVLLSVLAIDQALSSPQRPFRRGAVVLVGVYLLLNYGNTIYLIQKHQDTVAQNQALARHLTPYNARRVVAPLSFIFNQIKQFQIQGDFCYYLLSKRQPASVSPEWFFHQAAGFGRQLLLLNDESLKQLNLPRPVRQHRYGDYRFSHRYGQFYIYQYVHRSSNR